MSESKEVMLIPEVDTVRGQLQKINEFQAVIRNTLKEGHDYGVIPGTGKPSLLKSGAEKIFSLWGCRPEYEELEVIENWDQPFFYFKYKCKAVSMKTGYVLAEAIRSCNSQEDKYGYRWAFPSQLPEGINKETLKMRWIKTKTGKQAPMYRVPNEDVATLVNTIQSMGQKRAYVACALQMGALSDLFTQDLEDIAEVILKEEPEEPEEKPEPKPEPKSKPESKTEPKPEPKPQTKQAQGDRLAQSRLNSVRRWLKLDEKDDLAIELEAFVGGGMIDDVETWIKDPKNFQIVIDKLNENKIITENDEQEIPF